MLSLRLPCVGLLLLCIAGCPSRPTAPAAVPRTAEEQKALDLAKKLLANKKLDWGDATAIAPQVPSGTYLLTYPTPEDELKTLGERALTVNVKSGQAQLVPRR
jgi:hypothetical protein